MARRVIATVQTTDPKPSISSLARPRGEVRRAKTLTDFPGFLFDRVLRIAGLALGNLPQVGVKEFSIAFTHFANARAD
jgi:hypothetical protein